MLPTDEELVFEIDSVLGARVSLSRAAWEYISQTKHRDMSGRLAEVQMAVSAPDEVRRSKSASLVCLYYRVQGLDRYVCVVTRATGTGTATVATAYVTSRMKAGEQLWPK